MTLSRVSVKLHRKVHIVPRGSKRTEYIGQKKIKPSNIWRFRVNIVILHPIYEKDGSVAQLD